MKHFITLLIVLIVGIIPANAQSSEALTRKYFDLLQNKQWAEATELFDPQALADFKEMMSFLYELPDEQAEPVLQQFFGPGTTKESIKEMPPEDFFTAFMGAIMGQLSGVEFTKVEVIGTLDEGKDMEHVVVRTFVGMGEIQVEAMEVLTFRLDGDKRGIMLQGKLKGMAQQLKSAFGQ